MSECEHRFVTKGRRVTYCKNCEELQGTLRRDEEIESLKEQLKKKADKNKLLNERLHKAQMRTEALEVKIARAIMGMENGNCRAWILKELQK